jgi:hypothetical protein
MDMLIQNWVIKRTETSRKKMRIFGTNHFNALDAEKADADILALFTRTNTPHTDFNTAFDDFTTKNAMRKGYTALFTGLVDGLPAKIEDWEAIIVITHKRETPTYIQIFPRGRKGIYQGGYETIISNLNSFYSVLDSLTFPNNPKADVQAYITSITNARNQQLAAEELVDAASDILTSKHNVYAEIIFGNWGSLIDKFRATPDEANRFFDYVILKSHIKDEEEFKGNIAGGDTVLICSDNFEDDTDILLENPGVTTLKYFTAPDSVPAPSGDGIEIPSGSNKTVKASALGHSGNKYLKVTNMDLTNQGKYKVTAY